MRWLLPIGLGVAAAAVVLATREKKTVTTFNPGIVTRTSPGFNASPLVRYSGLFQPINPPQSAQPKQGQY